MPVSSPTSRRIGVALTAALSCAALVPGSASAAAPASGNAQVGTPGLTADAKAAGRAAHGPNATTEQSLAAYWTPQRMRAAKPVEDAPFFQAALGKHEQQSAIDQREAKAGRGRPAPQGAPFSVSPAIGSGPIEAAYNPNLSSWAPTARSNGKVFFVKSGVSYVCSGSIVNTEGADTVWTAGHCVHGGQGGTVHSNWTFVPAYDDDLANPRPYGTWSAAGLWTRTAWVNNSDFSEDMAVAIMNTHLGGWHIVNYFGGHGFTANQGKSVWENAMGYPAEAPFDGGNLYRCWGTSSPEWDFGFISAQTIKIPCDMTRGSSGGPWLYSYDGSWGYLNGVNSRIDKIVGPTIMLSPYFDDTAISLFNFTRYM